MTLGERLQGLMRIALLVFILAAASFLSAITAIRFAIHGREVTMPNLVGKSATEAQQMLAVLRLQMKVADRVYSDLPASQVVRQSPPGGLRLKVGQTAHVVLSLGPRAVTIPAVEGKSLRAARIELLRDGLQVGEISSLYLPDAATETVVQQDPRPGSGAASPHVNLLVSQGERAPAYVMPYLVGLDRPEAERRLAAAGLHPRITVSAAPEWPHNAVFVQAPQAGARVAPSVSVELQIAE